MEHLSTQEEEVLLGARDGLSYKEIGSSMGKSKSWVQLLLKHLIEEGYLKHERYKHRYITLTEKAKEYLTERNISYDRRPEPNHLVE